MSLGLAVTRSDGKFGNGGHQPAWRMRRWRERGLRGRTADSRRTQRTLVHSEAQEKLNNKRNNDSNHADSVSETGKLVVLSYKIKKVKTENTQSLSPLNNGLRLL